MIGVFEKFSSKSFGSKSLTKCRKNGFEGCAVFSESTLKFLPVNFQYNQSSGEKSKKLVIDFFIGCWMQKSVSEYLVPFSNGTDKTEWTPGGCSKKSYI